MHNTGVIIKLQDDISQSVNNSRSTSKLGKATVALRRQASHSK